MDKEYSAGAVVLRRDKDQVLVLLIYSARNSSWGFPKGHIEPGETDIEAAVREIREETGLSDLVFVDGFREEIIYPAISNRGPNKGRTIEKHAVYFLCETRSEEVVPDAREISDYKWLAIHEVAGNLAFENLKRLVVKVERWKSVGRG